jgi:transcriptional regulator with XRE-family HTH domain
MNTATLETAQIVRELKHMLKARGITYADLAGRIGLSEPSVKRILSRGSLSLTRLERICRAMDATVLDLVRLAGGGGNPAADTLSWDQEAELAANPGLLGCFYLLINGRRATELASELSVDDKQVRRWLARLNALGLVTLHAGHRAKIRTAPSIAWRKDGPVRALYEAQVRSEFLNSAFLATGEALHFRSAELSEASCQTLIKKLERLAGEFRDLADLDRSLPSREKRSVALLLACRPWVFSMFEGLKRAQRP